MQEPRTASLEEIFQKIGTVVYKNGLRTTEFFRDHDKLRSGIITENQVGFLQHLMCAHAMHTSTSKGNATPPTEFELASRTSHIVMH